MPSQSYPVRKMRRRRLDLPQTSTGSISSSDSGSDVNIDVIRDASFDGGLSGNDSRRRHVVSVANDLLADDPDATILDLSLPSVLWFCTQRYLSCCVRKEFVPLPGISDTQLIAVRRLIRRVSRRHCLFTYKCEEWFEGCYGIKQDGIEEATESSISQGHEETEWEKFTKEAACTTA
uniref:V2 protein n=1 Tax=Prunus geminivirus A TaxID=2022321 RepID=A0A455HFE0_9GEMI|nr:V2 protein [Prunus geminivirus A]